LNALLSNPQTLAEWMEREGVTLDPEYEPDDEDLAEPEWLD
jgi:hypothetical protein